MPSHTLALTFLTPVAGIIAAAIAIPAIAAVYFLKLRRRPARISSVMLWESAVRDLQANVPFRMIRPSWLLLLQLLIAALLAAALARPALNLPSQTTSRVIVAIDRSASMAARDAPPTQSNSQTSTRLQAAKREAQELIDRVIDAGGEAQIIAFAHRPQTLTPPTSNRALLTNAINDITQTDQPADFDRLLELLTALATADQPPDETATPNPPTIALISDGDLTRQSNRGQTVSPNLVQFTRVGPEPDQQRANFAIVALAARRDYEDPTLLRIFIRVQSTAPQAETIALTTRFNADIIDATSLDLPPATPQLPAEAAHSIELRTLDEGPLIVRIAREDALPTDNTAALQILPPAAPNILAVFPTPPRVTEEFAILEALAATLPTNLEVLTADQYAQRAEQNNAEQQTAPPDLIVFDRVRPTQLPPVPSLSLNATLPIPALTLNQPPRRQPDAFAFWQRTHPLFRGVALDNVRLDSPPTLNLPQSNDSPDQHKATALANSRLGTAIALLERNNIRRIVIAPQIAATTWWTDQSFPVFIANAVEFLTTDAAGAPTRAFTTSQQASLPASIASNAQTINLIPPTSDDNDPAQPQQPQQINIEPNRPLNLGILPNVGVWTAQTTNQTYPIPVNLLDPRESAIAAPDSIVIAGTPISTSPTTTIAPREIWRWLIAAAAILLAIEWTISVYRNRL